MLFVHPPPSLPQNSVIGANVFQRNLRILNQNAQLLKGGAGFHNRSTTTTRSTTGLASVSAVESAQWWTVLPCRCVSPPLLLRSIGNPGTDGNRRAPPTDVVPEYGSAGPYRTASSLDQNCSTAPAWPAWTASL